MKRASKHIALALMLFLVFGRAISIDNNKYFLNAFWSGVVMGLLFALFIFNFYLGYIEKDVQETGNKKTSGL